VSASFKPADVQGNIVRGYRLPLVRYLMLEVADRAAARRWLADSVSGGNGVPRITSEAPWGDTKPETCFNIGLTYPGLVALGTPDVTLDGFPTEFKQGMAVRAVKLGDVEDSAPKNWPAPFDAPDRIHLIATIYAHEDAHLDRVQREALAGGKAFRLLGVRDGRSHRDNFVHFGYRDNLTQPRFKGIHDSERYEDGQPKAPLGTVLLGYDTNFEGLRFEVPYPDDFGNNGSFNAFRVLAQDVNGFEKYLDNAADELLKNPKVDELLAQGTEGSIGEGLSRRAALREIVAANMCGRWRNGVPLALYPDTPNPPKPVEMTNFGYTSDSPCPYGAHIRRSNPRGGQIVQRVANNSRRLVRRGIPYGPDFDPAHPDDPSNPVPERGLLGNFIGANLGAQFEAMSTDWLNLGLQDPRVTGSNDALTGANDPETSWFDIALKSGETIRLRGLPRFVTTRGGAYTFLPSIPGIRFLGALTN
jgi:deferrochelatase/peroxidase EfeB